MWSCKFSNFEEDFNFNKIISQFTSATIHFTVTTVNSHLADNSLLQTSRHSGQLVKAKPKLLNCLLEELLVLQTLIVTDLQTLHAVPSKHFSCSTCTQVTADTVDVLHLQK